MDQTPPGEENPKDYATRRVDLEGSESAGEQAAPDVEKKSRTRKTPARPVEAIAPASAVTVPVEDRPLPPPPPTPPAPVPALPGAAPKNERIWIAAIIAISFVVLACICSCTILVTAFLNNAPW
jgi:hypothetical protein